MSKWIRVLLFAAGIARAQQSPPAPSFRVGTDLVQVSVVAQDKQGKPVAGLRREDFQIFDNGSPQAIQFFVAETEKSDAAPPKPKLTNTFNNQTAPASHSGSSVILIDNLFTEFGIGFDATAYVRQAALQALRSIPLGETIAIYALQRKLDVICEFTSDRDLLERLLGAWKPGVDTPGTTHAAIDDILGLAQRDVAKYDQAVLAATDESARAVARQQAADARRRVAGIAGNDPNRPGESQSADAIRIDDRTRAANSNEAMDLLADHLAGTPGRKNLIWIGASRFVVPARSLQKLIDAGVAIYPVGAPGAAVEMAGEKSTRYAPLGALAAMTGGVPYIHREDLDVVIREAVEDGRVSYTLGFYPPAGDPAPKAHQITVRVNRPDVTLRYRTGYQSQPRESVPAAPKDDLTQAFNRPTDTTAIPIQASVTRTQDRLNLQATLDVQSLDLILTPITPEQSLWTGKIQVLARFTTADGIVAGTVFSETAALTLLPGTYEAAARDGLRYHNIELTIPPKAAELKLLVSNPASGKIGTLTIPLSHIEESEANAK